MRILVLLLALILNFGRAHAGEVAVPEEQVSAYKTAVRKAFEAVRLEKCNTLDIHHIVANSSRIYVSDGGQPLLRLVLFYNGLNSKVDTLIYTDSTYTVVERVELLKYEYDEINEGSLKDPKIREDYFLIESINCYSK